MNLRYPAAALVGLSACLRPMQERAERDREVGHASTGAASIVVDEGQAAVRDLTEDAVVLWASAPSFRARWSSPANGHRTLEARNLLPDSQLTATNAAGETLTAKTIDEPLPTRKIWDIETGSEESIEVTVAPPDAHRRSAFSFAVLSDVQEAIDRVEDFYIVMNEDPTLHFVLGAGDLTERGTAGELREFQRRLRKLRIPYFATLGNHELGTTPVLWHDFFGRASHHFVYRGVHFSMIDSGSASVDPIVYDWMSDWLAAANDTVHIVAMHIPPVDPFGLRNGSFGSRNEAAKLLARLARGHVDLTLYGHIHSYYEFENAGIPAHISGGGGAIPERFDGIGRHFLVVDVDPDEGISQTRVVRID